MTPTPVNKEIRETDPPGHIAGPQKRYMAVFLACLGLATLIGAVGWNLLQAAPTQPTTPSVDQLGLASPDAPEGAVGMNPLQAAPTQPTSPPVDQFGPGSPYAPGGSVYDQQVPAAALSEAHVGSATPDASAFRQQVPPAFASIGSPIGPPAWAWPIIAGGTVLIAASTTLITAAVDRARHPCRSASPPGPADDGLIADLNDPAVEVLESL